MQSEDIQSVELIKQPEEEKIPIVELEWDSDEDSNGISNEELINALDDVEMDHILLTNSEGRR